jgi:phosphatidylinositol alpha-mannosyltransferase
MISTATFARARTLPGVRDRIVLIFNGVQPVECVPRAKARQILVPTVPPRATIVGGVGELHPNKNWLALINALPKLPSSVHVVIIGEGEERALLERQTAQLGLEARVHLVGYQTAAPLMNVFDVFVLPSKKEGLPYVLLEAALAKRPIVASDLPGNRDIIKSGDTGLLVNPEPNTLALTIQLLLTDAGMRTTYGQRAEAFVAETFSLSTMFDATFAVYSGSSSALV